MAEFSPYCDPSNGLFIQNLAIAAIIGTALGFAFGKLVRMQMTHAAKSPIRWLLIVSLLAFPLVAAFASLMIYEGLGPNADDCGGRSEHLALPAFMGLITAPAALIGLLSGFWWRPVK
jgi:hypothetical protein